jgi:hypothetical protein
MTTADPIGVVDWPAQPTAAPGARAGAAAGDYVGRHRRRGTVAFTLRRLFYVARHRRR